MATIDKNAFFKYNETRALAGYRSAWLVKEQGNNYYSLIAATESVPYVFGSKGTLEFNLLQAPVISQVEDKTSLESVDVEVLHHRDNAYRFAQLTGKTLDFLSVNAEMVAYHFVGTLEYRPNTADNDVNRATVTITPMSADTTPIYDARGMIKEALCFANVIPPEIATDETINLSVVQGDATITATKSKYNATDGTWGDATSLSVTDKTKVSLGETGLFAITVSDSAGTYAPWTTTVYVG